MAVLKSEADGNHPASHYLVVEDPERPSTWHLRVQDANGVLNHTLMGAAWASLHDGYRGNKYQGPGKEAALAKLKSLYKSEGMNLPAEASDLPRHLAVLLNGPGRFIQDAAAGDLHEIPIVVTGSWVKDGHKLSITDEDLGAMQRNFEKRKNDQVVIDYEHASEHPEISRGGPVPAAGWIHELKIGSSGDQAIGRSGNGSMNRSIDGQILTALVEWTPEAEQLIRGGQYRFFSPAIDWNYKDKTTGEPQGATLTSGALTNHPFLEELPPIMLTDLETGNWKLEAGADVSTGHLDAPLKTVSVAYPGPKATNHEPQTTNSSKGAKMDHLYGFLHGGQHCADTD